MNILFVDACPRKESRTRKLAEEVCRLVGGEIARVNLSEIGIPDIDENAVIKRTADVKQNCYGDSVYDLAKQFAAADRIIIAAPYWDLSFPAILKKYIEAITVSGITFRYTEEGFPMGLCKADALYYVTTAGGPIFADQFGYGYIETLAQKMYGIKECHCFRAENLDVIGVDVDAIMQQAMEEIVQCF